MSHLASGREARMERYFSVQIIFAQSGSQDFQATREQKIRMPLSQLRAEQA